MISGRHRVAITALGLGLLAAISPAARAAPGATSPPLTRARYLMGTLCFASVPVTNADTAAAARAAEEALDRIARLDPVLSSWNEASELRRLNARAGREPVACTPDLFAAVRASLEAAAATGGAFDPTVEPLLAAWDVRGAGRVPGADERRSALARVGWRKVACDPASGSVRFAADGVALDLGGIGKGYALDRALEGMPGCARLNFGGEVRTRSCGERWRVEIAHPADRLDPVVWIEIGDGAVSTSAQSEQTQRAGGRDIGHILDPRTGEPVPTAASVTVIAGDATRADAFSTALLVMGREGASRFARAHPELGVVWLEPEARAVRAWKWNQDARAVDGARVRWMN